MPTIDEFSNSQFLTQADVDPAITVTISAAEPQQLTDGSTKLVASFKELDKGLVLGARVNREAVAEVAGTRDYSQWPGTAVELYRDANVTNPSGQRTGGIRVRAPAVPFDDDLPDVAKGKAPKAAAAAVPVPFDDDLPEALMPKAKAKPTITFV